MSKHIKNFLVDAHGNKTAVLIGIDHYSELLEAQEELAAIRAYDEAKVSDDEGISLTQAIKEIERG